LISTFGGDNGVFHEAATDPENPRLFTLDWKDNPTQTKLAYTIREGKPVAMRPDEQERVEKYVRTNAKRIRDIERRGHKMEGKLRSPWYDSHCCLPGATPRFVARELDMDPRGAVGKVFPTEILDDMKKRHCKPPLWQGRLVFDSETLDLKGLVRQENGPLKLWFLPGVKSTDPPGGKFTIGCDVAYGGGGDFSSNSAACGVRRDNGEQVLEYATMGLSPIKFARVAVVLSRWLSDAYLAWESGGPGSIFEKEVIEVLHYGNIFYRDVEEVGNRAKSRKPGWLNTSDDAKGQLFDALSIAMEQGDFLPRSEDLLRECGEYEYEKGKLVHRPSKQQGLDGKPHADRAISAGVAWLAHVDQGIIQLDSENVSPENVPYGCPEWRFQREQAKHRQPDDDDDNDFTLSDLLRESAV
jgi:hypothetical protein